MCRLLFVSGKKEHIDKAFELIDALVSASRSDNTYGNTTISHKDGFGYVIFGKNGENISNLYFRSTNPIFESNSQISKLKEVISNFDSFAFGIHVRLMSKGNVDIINTHPYMFSLPNGKNLFFMHNGTLDKPKMEEEFEIEVSESLSDSFAFSCAISKNFESFYTLKELIKDGTKFVIENSGFNTITFLLDGNEVNSILTVYYRGKRDYYKAYLLEDNGLIAFMSSTLKQFLTEPLKEKLQELGNEPLSGTIITLEKLLTKEAKVTKEEF